MFNVKYRKLPELAVPAVCVAILLGSTFWILDVALNLHIPGSQELLASLLSSQPGSQLFGDSAIARRLVNSVLIGLAGATGLIITCRGWQRSTRVDVEKPLIRLDLQHQALLESTFDSILLVSEKGRVRSANETAGKMFGGAPEAFVGLSANTFFTVTDPADEIPEPTRTSDDIFSPALGRGQTRVTALGLDGRSFPAEVRGSEIDFNGKRHFLLCVKELTGEIEAKKTLQQSESRYRSLFNNMLDGAYRSTVDGEILNANPALVRLLGYASADEIRKSIRTPDLYRQPEKRQQMQELLTRTQAIRNFEIELIRKDGTFVTVLANIRVIHGDPEHRSVYEGTLTDVSDVAAARSALRKSEELFRAMTEHALDIVTVLDQQGNAVYVSPSGARLLGIQPGAAIGWSIFPSIHREDLAAVKEKLDKAFSAPGSPHTFSFRFLRPDGQVLFLESVGSTYLGHDGEARAVIHSRDITERRRTEAQLQQAQKMQAVGQLTGGIAHDFNNLLTVIVGNLQLLEEQVQGRDEMNQVQTALRASMQGAELTRRLLAFSRRQFLEPKVINVNELLEDMAPIIRRSLNESIRISSDHAPDIWPTKVDPAQLESAFLNLAINAGDSMRYDGQLTISTRNRVLTAAELPADATGDGNDYICITFADTGCGMTDEVVQRAIEPFFSTKNSSEGTGLGLSMVYGFVRQSGGHMRIGSKVNVGTRIEIFLPSTMQSAFDFSKSTTAGDLPCGSETIMVVDDNLDVRDSTVALLRSLGYRVIAADHGRSALHLLQTEKIGLLFSDVMMPQLSGIELAKVAKQLQPNIRVLLTTGFADVSDTGEFEELHSYEVLQKPYTKRDIATRIRHQLDT